MIATTKPGFRRETEFKLDGIVPWGRRLDEYSAFFELKDIVPPARILDIGGGPSSFAFEAGKLGFDVTAVDPVYAFEGHEIRERFDATTPAMRAGLHAAAYRFKWKYYASEENIYRHRLEALNLFLSDFEGAGRQRYQAGALPDLPFDDAAFDLALISHLLFLYGDELDSAFHIRALREALRVAGEVRVFPLVNLDGRPSSHLPDVMQALADDGFDVEIVRVDFEFQVGATRMLRIRHV